MLWPKPLALLNLVPDGNGLPVLLEILIITAKYLTSGYLQVGEDDDERFRPGEPVSVDPRDRRARDFALPGRAPDRGRAWLLAKAELSRNQMLGTPAASRLLPSTGSSEACRGRDKRITAWAARFAAEMDLRDVGLLFYLAASSTTVATALETPGAIWGNA